MIDFGQLKWRTVAITGASRGIGRETALLLAGLGANLVIGARNEEELEAVALLTGARTLPVPLDVTDEHSVEAFLEKGVQRFGHIDALINSAGVGVFEPLLSLSVEDFDLMIGVNLKGTFLTGQMFAQHMVMNGTGRIINIVSVAGNTALPGCGGYSASKFGVMGLTRVMQAELRGKGVQVTAVVPGAVASSFWDSIEPKPDVESMIPVQSLAKHIVYLLCQPEGSVIDEMMIMPPLGIL
jgi:3-oxoacyl-[acyl-carrier protein] reductase